MFLLQSSECPDSEDSGPERPQQRELRPDQAPARVRGQQRAERQVLRPRDDMHLEGHPGSPNLARGPDDRPPQLPGNCRL